MADETKEHKEDKSVDSLIDEQVDNELDKLESGQTTKEGSTEKVEQEQEQEAETDSEKTDSTAEASEDDAAKEYEGLPEGFNNHPAWKKREEKLKEALRERERLEEEQARYAELLNDPDVYKKYLTRQGLSDFEVRQKMEAKGFPAEQPKQDPMFDRIAKKLGWNPEKLTPQQRQAIDEQIAFNQAVAEEVTAERLKPYESERQTRAAEKVVDTHLGIAEQYAKEDGIPWEVAEELMEKKLKELDRIAGAPIAIHADDLYLKATRGYKHETSGARERSEERKEKKAKSRPLGSNPTATEKPKAQPHTNEEYDSFVDEKLDSLGFPR